VIAVRAHENLFPRPPWRPQDLRGATARAFIDGRQIPLQRPQELARVTELRVGKIVRRARVQGRLGAFLKRHSARRASFDTRFHR